MMLNSYPKATSNSSTWEPGLIYKYINHPSPCKCIMDKFGNLSMQCTVCMLNTTSNKCKCSRQHDLLHKDQVRNNAALSGRTVDTERNNISFKLAKGGTREELRIHVNVAEIGYGKGIAACDHIVSPKGYKTHPYDFDMTNEQHHDFICHIKNSQLLTPHENSVKSSHNDPDELKIIFAEFDKQTPPGDIHDILIARRKRGDVVVKEEEEEEEVDEEQVELDREEAEIAKANAEIAKANAEIAKANAEMAKREAEFKAKKIRKEIKNKLPELRNTFKANIQSKIDALLKEMADADKGLHDDILVDAEVLKLTAKF
jgi:hypothetical protein